MLQAPGRTPRDGALFLPLVTEHVTPQVSHTQSEFGWVCSVIQPLPFSLPLASAPFTKEPQTHHYDHFPELTVPDVSSQPPRTWWVPPLPSILKGKRSKVLLGTKPRVDLSLTVFSKVSTDSGNHSEWVPKTFPLGSSHFGPLRWETHAKPPSTSWMSFASAAHIPM